MTERHGIRDPAAWVARLVRALRREGVPCSLTDSRAGLQAFGELDAEDPLDLFFGLRAALLDDVAHREAFERCFWRAWRGATEEGDAEGDLRVKSARSAGEVPADRGRSAEDEKETGTDGDSDRRDRGPALERLREGSWRQGGPATASEEAEGETAAHALYSPVEALSRRDLGTLAPEELRETERAFDRVRVRLAARRGRRTEPSRRRGRVDLRRSLREAVRHDGELLRLARRRRALERPRVVLLCDVSGSMERHARFLLRLLLSAGRERDVEAFVFGTRLTRVTQSLRRGTPARRLERIAEAVPDWSSGTRIGASLAEFVERHGRSLLGRKTVVVILSDGLERGEIEPLERAMRTISRRARRVVWMNPLAGGPDYEPSARGMEAALPWVDDLVPGASLADLRRLPELLRL